MPSVSKAQQRFMGLVHAYKKGEVPASQVSKAVKDAAKSMKKKSTKKFAGTKHKGLPNKVRSEYMNEDGHTDVASIERKLKLIMQDAMDTLNALKNLSNEDSLPSWWTDKITLAKDYVAKSRDYIMNPAESVNEDITSAGYYFLRKAAYSIGIALRDLNSGIKRQNDKIVLNEIDYIYDKVIDMKRMLKNKKYNESVNETPQKVAKLLIKRGNKPNRVKDMVKKHYKKAKKDRSKAGPSDLASYISFLDANESVNEGKGVEKILKMASEKSFGKIAGRTVDGMTAGLFKAVYDKAPQNSKDKIDKMSEKQLYVFMGKLWNKFGRQVKLS